MFPLKSPFPLAFPWIDNIHNNTQKSKLTTYFSVTLEENCIFSNKIPKPDEIRKIFATFLGNLKLCTNNYYSEVSNYAKLLACSSMFQGSSKGTSKGVWFE